MGVVVAQLERDSVLSRPDPYGKLKPVAANIDQIMLVIAPFPEPHANLIDRYLVAAETVDIEPVILLNKTDLLALTPRCASRWKSCSPSTPPWATACCTPRSRTVGWRNCTVHCASAPVFSWVSRAWASRRWSTCCCRRRTCAWGTVGNTQKGTHTTTTAQLFHLTCGGSLIDSPGIREFGLWHMTKEQVEQGFANSPPAGHLQVSRLPAPA